jgi:hypothetical protein
VYGTISSTGLYTAPAAVSADLRVAVTATSLANTSVSATFAILVEAPTITSVAVVCNPTSILTTGTSTCSATVQGTGAYNPAVTWTATRGTITSGGIFTPSGAGNATITATSVQDTSKFSSSAVSVAVPITITSVTVVCNPAAVVNTQTTQCTATTQGSGNYNTAVIWQVNNYVGGNSTVGTISPQGVYQGPDPIPNSLITISAISEQDNTTQGSANIGLSYPLPVLNTATPTNFLWMSSGAQIQISGSNFSHTSSVLIGGTTVSTTYISNSQLTANVPASALKSLGTLQVAVNTPSPGGGATANSAVQVSGGSIAVTINSLPSAATTTIQVTGPQSFNTKLAASGTLNGLAAGTYTITAAIGSTPDSTFPPDQPVQTTTIASLAPIGISVDYNTGLYKSVKYLDTAGINSIAFVPGQHTFTVDLSSAIGAGLLPGDVLVIPDCTAVPGGAVVRVDSVSSSSQIIVNFEGGNLGDVFSALNLNVTEEIGADQITNVQSQLAGVNITSHARTVEEKANAQPLAGSPCNGNPNTIEVTDSGDLTLSTTPPPPGSPPPTVTANAGLHVSASLQFCPTVAFNVRKHYAFLDPIPVLDGASISAGMDVYADLSASTEAALALTKTIPLAEYDAVKIPIPDTGGALYLTPTLTLLLGMDGSFNGKASMGLSQEATGTVEVDYDVHTGAISSINNTTVNPPTPDNPILEASASAKVSVGLKMELTLNAGLSFIDLSLASVGGYVEPRVYLEADADINKNPWWTLSAGLDALAGMDFSFLGDTKNFDSDPIPLFSKQILQSSGPFLKNVTLTGMYAAGPGSGAITSASGPQTVNIIGSGFAPNMTLKTSFLASPPQSTVIPSPNILSATADVLLNKSGLWKAQVLNTDGSHSPVLTVSVQPPQVQPTIIASSPDFIQGSTNNQPFTLSGQGFENGLTIQLCKQVCYASLSGSQITASTPSSITALAVLSAGSWTAQVFNPDGGTSNIYPFTVQPAFSASVSPGAGTVGTTSFTISGVGATPNNTVTRNSTLPNGTVQSSAVTTNSAGEFSVPSFLPSIAGSYVERFTDDATGRKTPAVSYIVSNPAATGPTAHFTMSSQGLNASDGGTLTLTVATGGSASVTFTSTSTPGSANITNYAWTSNGTSICGSSSTCTYSFNSGSYTIALTVNDANNKTSPATGTVVVSAASGTPSYSVSMGGSGQSITAGNSATFSLTATSVNGFSNTVSLPQASMSISGANSSWSPSSILITPSSQGTSTLTVYTNTSTPANTYSITEYMPNGQSASVLLTVTSSSGGGGGQAPSATTGSASAITTTTATLGATVNPHGADTHVYFEYGTSNTLSSYYSTPSQDVGAGTTSVGPSANIASLTAGTQYYFRVVAYNSNGSTPGSIVPFSTSSAAQTGPTAHFTMTGQGQTFNDGGTLPLTLGVGATALVSTANTSTPGSAPITTYLWTFNGTQQCGNSSTCNENILAGAGGGTVTITLTVTDSNGKQSSPASGTVFVAIPTVNLSVTRTTCHGSVPGSVPEIDLSFTVSGGTSSTFDIYRNGTLLYTANTGTTFQNYGSNLTPEQTFNYYVVVHLAAGGTATSNTVSGVAPSNCH